MGLVTFVMEIEVSTADFEQCTAHSVKAYQGLLLLLHLLLVLFLHLQQLGKVFLLLLVLPSFGFLSVAAPWGRQANSAASQLSALLPISI